MVRCYKPKTKHVIKYVPAMTTVTAKPIIEMLSPTSRINRTNEQFQLINSTDCLGFVQIPLINEIIRNILLGLNQLQSLTDIEQYVN